MHRSGDVGKGRSLRPLTFGVVAGSLVGCLSLVADGTDITGTARQASAITVASRRQPLAPAGQVGQASAPVAAERVSTTLVVNADARHQTWDGVGAIIRSGVLDGRDLMNPRARARAADLLFRTIRIRAGRLDAQLLESPGSYAQRRNDNDDPFALSWRGFQTAALDSVRTKMLDLPEARAFDYFQNGQMINTRWASPWLAKLRATDYERYLDEAGEQLAAACQYWRRLDGKMPALWQLFNEPLSGNREVAGGTRRDLVDLVKRAGQRLAEEGCGTVRFLVGSEESEAQSYTSAAAILEDQDARRYVGAIGYHVYPYGSVYSSIPRILGTVALGRREARPVERRRRLRELARQYDLPLWMTEVSHGGVDARSYEAFRGRTIHIHDELEFADASAYFGMNTIWDMKSHLEHFHTRDGFFDSEGNILLYDNDRDDLVITGLGYAMGHYARWVPRGAVRVEASSGDPLLLATAFRVDSQRQLVLVLINNGESERDVGVTVRGLPLGRILTGEQSTREKYWATFSSARAVNDSQVQLTLPALSVTTVVLEAGSSPTLN